MVGNSIFIDFNLASASWAEESKERFNRKLRKNNCLIKLFLAQTFYAFTALFKNKKDNVHLKMPK